MSLGGDFLTVKQGDPISAEKWTRMQRESERNTILYGGENTRVNKNTRGVMINAFNKGGFLHPWRALVSSQTATIWPGTINGTFPKIKDQDGTLRDITERPPPLIPMVGAKFNPSDIGWIALELQLEDDYRKIKTATVVQTDYIVGSEGHGTPGTTGFVQGTNNPFFYFGNPGIGDKKVRYQLVRLRKVGVDTKGNNLIDSFQVAMFNLNWACKPPAGPGNTGSQIPRHFFWPA